jgi:hypothetical protein
MTPIEEENKEVAKEQDTPGEPSSRKDVQEPQKWIRSPRSNEQFTIDYETKIKVLLEEFLDGLFDNYMLWMSVACFRTEGELLEIPYVHIGISPDADIEGLEFPLEIGEAGFGLVLGRTTFGGRPTPSSGKQESKEESSVESSEDESDSESVCLSKSDFPSNFEFL